MRYRPLGERGPTVSVVGVGGNNVGSRLDEDGTKAVVHAALDAGVTLFVITARQAGAYKPDRQIFEHACRAIGVEPSQVIHTAEGWEYDLIPTRDLGLERRVWINRHGRPGSADYRPCAVMGTSPRGPSRSDAAALAPMPEVLREGRPLPP
ncbi:hypothetical protein GCM10010234_07620 [Streptomyces hawaiiensis]|uniref:HAD family hydrolase n=1 Tax=Streptomyces hawaiiensis TaxID=67305 RepID=UPI0031D38442